MNKTLAIATVGLALIAAGCDQKAADTVSANTAAPVTAAPYSGQDWTQTVVKTPEGGYRMGSPDAPVKLIEYASITCPHCRDFSKTGGDALRASYVRTGKVSWEYRNFVLNALDVAVSLVARCQGPDTFFPFVDQLYLSQTVWAGKFNQIDQSVFQSLGSLPQEQQFAKMVELTDLDDFFKTRGVSAEKISACLSNKPALAELLKIREQGATVDKVDGTPNFLINGVRQEGVYDWAGLEPKLKEQVR